MAKGCCRVSDEPIVLKVYIHCEGCENEVLRCLRGYEGVREIKIDGKSNKVTVKGKGVDPMSVVKRVRKKTGKYVKLISPLPKEEEETEEEEKPPEGKVFEVVLKVYLHCEGCEKEVKRCIHNLEGVETVHLDMRKNLVTVKGTMEAEKLVELMAKKTGRHARILKETIIVDENCDNKNEEDEEEDREDRICYHYCTQTQVSTHHQLFSDENPNACIIA